MARISIDCDACLLDFHNPFLSYVNGYEFDFLKKIGKEKLAMTDFTRYPFWDKLGKKEYWEEVFRRFYCTDEFADLPAVEGAIDSIATLGETNHLFVLSSRPEKIRKITADNIRRKFHYSFKKEEDIILTGSLGQTGKDKADIALERMIDGHIDDDLFVACECARKNVGAYLFNLNGSYGWNKSENNPEIVIPRQVQIFDAWWKLTEEMLAEYG